MLRLNTVEPISKDIKQAEYTFKCQMFFFTTCRFHFSLHQSIQSNQSGNVFVSWTQVGYWRQALPMLTLMMQA